MIGLGYALLGVIAVGLIIAGSVYGCEQSGIRETNLRAQCVNSGGTVIEISGPGGHHCVANGQVRKQP